MSLVSAVNKAMQSMSILGSSLSSEHENPVLSVGLAAVRKNCLSRMLHGGMFPY